MLFFQFFKISNIYQSINLLLKVFSSKAKSLKKRRSLLIQNNPSTNTPINNPIQNTDDNLIV